MPLPHDLLDTARSLSGSGHRPAPSQADLRRSLSTIYCALFHAVAGEAANLLIGPASAGRQTARSHAYRAVDHAAVRRACLNKELTRSLSKPVLDFADMFARLQAERHKADYDPDIVLFAISVRKEIGEAAVILDAFLSASEEERRAFLAIALFKPRAS